MLDYDVILFVDCENTLCPLFSQYNLLSNQEALIKQITSSNELSPKSEDVLYVKDQRRQNFYSEPSSKQWESI